MQLRESLQREVNKAVVGMEPVVGQILVALLVGGHVLLEGVPGTAKTLLVRTIATALGLPSQRVQFTPDMMPSDLVGTMVLRDGELSFRRGPIFTNMLLGDEINRTPPKTQTALLEVMEERTVTVEGTTHKLSWPYLVAATQNPVEYEGTYPLPEAQLDRFLFKIDIPYPSEEVERQMLWMHHQGMDPKALDALGIEIVASVETLHEAAQAAKGVHVSQEIAEYLLQVVRQTRNIPTVSLGASPRASAAFLHASKAWAYVNDRDYVMPEDIQSLAPAILGHRLQLAPEAALEGYQPSDIISAVLNAVPVPR